MDRPLLFPPDEAEAGAVASVVGTYRHTITLGIILLAHLLTVVLVEGRAVLFGPMLLLGLYLIGFLLLCERNRFSLCILVVGSLALAASAASLFHQGTLLTVVALAWHSLFEILLIVFMLGRLFKQRKMPFDAIMAGIVAFLFMAGLWAQFYGLVVLISPGAMRGPDGALGPHPYVTLYYFSVVTLTTAGFGDVVPVSDMARMLAAYEALLGQVYLAVFIALLMGRHFAVHAAPPAAPSPAPAKGASVTKTGS
jgi:hypothetical protein